MIATGPRRNTHIVLGVQNTQGLDFAHFHKCCGAQLAQNLQSLLGIFTELRPSLVHRDGLRFGEQVPLLTNSIIRHNVLSEHISWGF